MAAREIGARSTRTRLRPLLSLEALAARTIPVLGLVLNGPLHPANRETLETVGGAPVLAELTPQQELNQKTLQRVWDHAKLGSND